MERRTFLSLVSGVPLLAVLAACGSDDLARSDAPLSSVPDTARPSVDDVADVRFEFGYYGGFTTREVSFQMPPTLLVASGKVFTPTAVPAVYPGPLLPPGLVRTVTPVGVDALVAAARDAGMFADVVYDTDQHIADASTATLVIDVGTRSFRHEAYALGAGGPPGDSSEVSAEREAFAAFADRLSDIEAVVGSANLGVGEVYVPDAYQLIAFPAGDLSGFDIEPTLVDWPSTTGIVLGELDGCVEVSRGDVGNLFDGASQVTFYVEDGIT